MKHALLLAALALPLAAGTYDFSGTYTQDAVSFLFTRTPLDLPGVPGADPNQHDRLLLWVTSANPDTKGFRVTVSYSARAADVRTVARSAYPFTVAAALEADISDVVLVQVEELAEAPAPPSDPAPAPDPPPAP